MREEDILLIKYFTVFLLIAAVFFVSVGTVRLTDFLLGLIVGVFLTFLAVWYRLSKKLPPEKLNEIL